MSTYTPTSLILTAGPDISELEVKYVTDAVKTGWNESYRDYLTRFESAFADYLGVKYAWSTSSGTGALHIALMACDIGPDDEVIVPEITFIASSNAVEFVGAKPVFVDVDPETMCIDVTKVEAAITKRTKAIMPVDKYGHPVDMDALRKIAKKHKLYIIEDACPAVGSLYKGKKVGSMADIAAFSFQGAKILVTGEGGMIVSNNKSLFEKAQYYGNHARDAKKGFWHPEVGYMYRMANLLGALGLAQLERIDSFVEKKRTIHDWYKNKLDDAPHIVFMDEAAWATSNHWMNSIILKKDAPITREEMMSELKKRLVDSRPVFYPITMMPMYRSAKTKHPMAYWMGTHGINLPSGLRLKKKEVDYICEQVIDILATSKHKRKRG